ncbi:MAG: phage tail protein, partial [Allosphingosinicella sp.]
ETEISAEDGASAGGKAARRERGHASIGPAEVALGYYDLDRDYQAGLQRARRAGGRGGERLALPVALAAADAKALAAARLARLAAAGETLRLRFATRCLALGPGIPVRVAGIAGRWLIAKVAVERLVVEAELVRLPALGDGTAAATPGRVLSEPDAQPGPTRLLLVELPADGEALSAPRVFAAAAGASEGWRPVPLSTSRDAGISWAPVGRSAPAAVIGITLTPLGTGGGGGAFDTSGAVEIELLRDDAWLESRGDAALVAGDNAALIGGEIVQFGGAEPLGGRRFRLSRLLRGRRGTEWAAGGAAAGAPFLLLDPSTLFALDLPPGSVGGEIRLASDADADEAEAPATLLVTGEGLRPPSPVHLRGTRAPDGSVALSWVRRSRFGWAWLDGADAPLGEEREAYRVTIGTGAATRSWETAEPRLALAAGDLAELAGALAIEIVQLGTHAASHPARLVID